MNSTVHVPNTHNTHTRANENAILLCTHITHHTVYAFTHTITDPSSSISARVLLDLA